MEQKLRRNYAAAADVQIRSEEEECAPGMERSRRSNSAVVKDVQPYPVEEECAGSMERRKKYNRKMCAAEGCDNLSRGRGVCIRHGATIKLCSSEGCTNIAVKGRRVCNWHGANPMSKPINAEAMGATI
eukprot:scaffold14691_cov152-Skeletonema_dohrnii-CCMP3373.AAC.5